jgi:hypothetical protein
MTHLNWRIGFHRMRPIILGEDKPEATKNVDFGSTKQAACKALHANWTEKISALAKHIVQSLA